MDVEKKLKLVSKKIQESIALTNKMINEARPIAQELGFDIDPNTGELFKPV